jgi:hypothetical protein
LLDVPVFSLPPFALIGWRKQSRADFEVLKPQSDVDEINSLYADVCGASRPAFEKAIELGRLLNRAKRKAGRHWTEWAEKNLTFTVELLSPTIVIKGATP